MAEFLYATSHITGTCPNPDNALGSSDGSWAGGTTNNVAFDSRWAIGDPVDPLSPSATQTIRVLARKTNHSTNCTITVGLWENGSEIATIISSTAVSSTTGVTLTGTFNSSVITNRNDVEIRVIGGVGGGGASNRSSLQFDSIEWEADTAVAIPSGGAVGSVGWAGSADGTAGHSGAVSGAIGWAGTADGVAPTLAIPEGAASGSVNWAGSAVGPLSSARWLALPGTAGNYARTPTTTGLDVTNDLDIMARVDADLISGNTDRTFIGRRQSSSAFALVYRLGQEPNDLLKLEWDDAADTAHSVSATAALPSGQQLLWVRATLDVDNGAGAYEVKFWTSTTDTQDPDAVSWTQLGATVTGGSTTSVIDGRSSQLEVGSYNSGGVAYGSAIDIYRGIVRDGIGGTVLADFNGDDFTVGDSDTDTAVDSTGKTWTIFGADAVVEGSAPAASEGIAAGAVDWAGSATGTATRAGDATGSLTWAGTVTGAAIHAGSAIGSVSWSGTAAGESPTVGGQQGSATGSVAWAGSATGESPTVGAHEGSATGTLEWSGAATGTVDRGGSSTGTITWAGSATGVSPAEGVREGSVNGTISWTGTATGVTVREGSATGTVDWAGTAEGRSYHESGVVGAVAWAGTVIGRHPNQIVYDVSAGAAVRDRIEGGAATSGDITTGGQPVTVEGG